MPSDHNQAIIPHRPAPDTISGRVVHLQLVGQPERSYPVFCSTTRYLPEPEFLEPVLFHIKNKILADVASIFQVVPDMLNEPTPRSSTLKENLSTASQTRAVVVTASSEVWCTPRDQQRQNDEAKKF